MDKVTGYIFHYNKYRKLWAAVPRGKEKEYWNIGQERHKEEGILYSDSIMTLLKFLKGEF